MPDKHTYNILLSKGIRVDNCPFNRFDSLASEDDLSSLFEVLNSVKDVNGNPPIITANCVVANPDFERIRIDKFQAYHYELFTETLKKYPRHANSYKLWKEGIEKRLLFPQFHGREHLNVSRWMRALSTNQKETLLAFDNNLFGLSTTITTENRESFLAAFDAHDKIDKDQKVNIVQDGLNHFRLIFGYQSKSFIAPNYIWPSEFEEVLSQYGVKYIQGKRIQLSPDLGKPSYKKIVHYTGQKNKYDQIFTVRNCSFEPSFFNSTEVVNNCLSQIRTAFAWDKPAVVETHRINFIGFIESANRDKYLKLFIELLRSIKRNWPDVEFVTSHKLGEIINIDLT
jgi:hypothetical protein